MNSCQEHILPFVFKGFMGCAIRTMTEERQGKTFFFRLEKRPFHAQKVQDPYFLTSRAILLEDTVP